MSQKITPFLWFDHEAEEAAKFYVSVFKNNPAKPAGESKIEEESRYDEAGAAASGRPKGSVMVVSFLLNGQQFTALNGGPHFKMSGAVSFVINCATQEEVDYFWDKLTSDGGEAGQCGWVNHDKFGVTWQVVPDALTELLGDPDPVKSGRVMKAMLGMTKIDIAGLKKAHEGK